MRGFCSRCKEYRSNDGENAWGIRMRDGYPCCEKCGRYIDVLDD